MNKTMYNTVQVSPVRDTYTSDTKTRDRLQLSYHQSLTARPSQRKYRTHHCDLLNTQRPLSSATIDSSVSYCRPRQGQLFLRDSFPDDMSSYIVHRIRSDTKKHQQSFAKQTHELANQIDSIYSNEKERNIPRNYFSSKICSILQPSPYHVTKVIAEPFLLNCREKLRRMIERKKENESKYAEVKVRIQSAVKAKQPQINFKNHQVYIQGRDDLRSLSVKMARTIDTNRDYSQIRYKRRLIGKHNRNTGMH